MAIYSGATFRPVDWAERTRDGTKPTAVVLHVTASNATSQYDYFNDKGEACSHFHVAKNGHVEQYIDTKYRSAADLDGNYRTISVETQGLDDGTGWTSEQLTAIAGIVAWAHDTHGIPLRLMATSETSEHGLGWHRLGIDGNWPALPSVLAGRKQRGGGEHWSNSTGKTCPCDPRIYQVDDVLAQAQKIAGGQTPDPDDGDDDMTRSRSEGAAWAKGKIGYVGYGGMCLQFTREAYNIASKYGYAREAWDKAKHRHSTSSTSGIPYGVPIFLDKSSSEYGHVAVYVGSGQMVTTHASSNTVGQDAVSTWINSYGYHLLGWSEDLNGVLIPTDDSADNSSGSGGSGGGSTTDVDVDGIWGSGTTKQRQTLLKNKGLYSGKVDGTLDHQNPYWREENPGLTSGWGWDSNYKGKGGSSTIRADQQRLAKAGHYQGAVDGLAGPEYFKAIQREQGTPVDGEVDHPSKMVKAMQTDGNKGKIS